ncbi:MAG: S9 family peptidase [Asgard group archaeon]|nr:S9 family peptidase [Asgard group archaeon]
MNNTKNSKKYKPKMKELFLLPELLNSVPNPDGSKVAYTDCFVNLRENSYDIYCYIYDVLSQKTYRLSQFNSVYNLRWYSKDSLALIGNDANKNPQIFLYKNLIGDSQQITFHPKGIRSFELFKKGFIYIANDPDVKTTKIANYIHVEEEKSTSALYYTNLEYAFDYKKKLNQTTKDSATQPIKPVIEISKLLDIELAITQVVSHSATNTLFLQCQLKPDLQFNLEKRYFRITIDADVVLDEFIATKSNEVITKTGKMIEIALPKGANIRDVSQDGDKLLLSYQERDLNPYTQSDLFIIDLKKASSLLTSPKLKEQMKCITRDFDFEPNKAVWTNQGILVNYWNESTGKFALISETGKITKLDMQGLSFERYSFEFSESGWIGFVGGSPTKVVDANIAHLEDNKITDVIHVSNFQEKVANWDFGTVESIRWKSKDGTEIEGILRKPLDFDPKKKYPLIFMIHGGPAWTSPNLLFSADDRAYYPTIQFCYKDILILMPNYRGSIGRGQWFKELGVDNLGIGDMWDIESAIDHLSSQGFIDESRIGSMGWSQGGYISAFLGMHSNRFKAISSGASVSSWYTFYISSDLRHSVNITGNPIEPGMMEIYDKTAPISGIENANTPMLLQHGKEDQRISVVSAMELYRSLKDKGVQTELFIYPGMGHAFSRPQEVYAALIHNYRWFMYHFFGEELDFT